MRKKDRRRYSREFKMEAVNLAKSSGKPIAEIARELDRKTGTVIYKFTNAELKT